jgi:hypothetical protein
MRRKADKPGMMATALRRAIAESGMTFLGMEQRTGIKRQSLMTFARGESTLRLNSADDLAAFFGFRVLAPKRRKARKGTGRKG